MLMTNHKELLSVAHAMRDYIDAIPDSAAATFPAMPGFDREWADEVIESAEKESNKVVWLSFNTNGSICSTSKEKPSSKYDQWDNLWVKMISD